MTDGERAYRALKPRHQHFVDLLVERKAREGGSQGECWTAAGFKAAGDAARANASKWLSKPNNRSAYEWRLGQVADRAAIDLAQVVAGLAAAFLLDAAEVERWVAGEEDPSTGKAITLRDLPIEVRRCINGIEIKSDGTRKLRLVSREAAARLLAPWVGLLTERVEIVAPDEARRKLGEMLGMPELAEDA
jgi:hypothetical protein